MSMKRHCEHCDTSEHPRGLYGRWLHISILQDHGDPTLGGADVDRLAGDYCCIDHLVEQIARRFETYRRISSFVD